MNMSVRIVTDSSCDLPAAVINQYGISVVPLYIHIGDKSYLDGIDMTREQFYQNLPSFPVNPTTAVPSEGKFRAVFDSLLDGKTSEILSIHVASSLSGTVNVAQMAANSISEIPMTVFDSRQLSMGTGFLVETAAKMADEGAKVSEILPVLEEQIKRTHVFAALDTLQYLRRSGRMNAILSRIGEILQIKPFLKMYDGVTDGEKIRTRKHAVARLIELLKKDFPYEKVALLHSAAAGRADEVLAAVQDLLPDKVIVEQINPIIGAHIGPGVLGFACVSRKK